MSLFGKRFIKVVDFISGSNSQLKKSFWSADIQNDKIVCVEVILKLINYKLYSTSTLNNAWINQV